MNQSPRITPARHAAAHARALRAATAVTLGVFALGAQGCAAVVHVPEADAQADDAQADVVTARDAQVADAQVADAQADDVSPDAGESCSHELGSEAYLACCERIGWDWNRGCAAWGPFVPPSMEDLAA